MPLSDNATRTRYVASERQNPYNVIFTTLFLPMRKSAFCRDDGEQQVGLLRRAGVQRGPARKDLVRAIERIVMQERSAAAQFILEVRQPRSGGSTPFIVATAHGQREAMARLSDHRRRPQLDIE